MRIWTILVMMVILSTSVVALSPAPEVDCCYDFLNDRYVNPGCEDDFEEPREEFCVQVLKEWNETMRAFALSAVNCCYDRLELGDAIDPGCRLAVGDFSYCPTLIAKNEARQIDTIIDDDFDKFFIVASIIVFGVPILFIILIIAVIWLAVRNHKLKKVKKGKQKGKKRKK